jgi:hypothetical protein
MRAVVIPRFGGPEVLEMRQIIVLKFRDDSGSSRHPEKGACWSIVERKRESRI